MATNWSERELRNNVDTKTFHSDDDGDYLPIRQTLHDRLVSAQLEGHESQGGPRLVLVSGGTASGKSEAAKKAQKDLPGAVYVNTDEVRALLPEFEFVEGTDKAGLLQEEAGDIRDQLLAEAVASGMHVIWDAPGSSTVAAKLKQIENLGYKIAIAYTHRTVEEAKVAAAYRATHASNPADRRVVPDEVIENSHRKAREGFEIMAAVPGREITVYDKTGKALGEQADVIYKKSASGEVAIRNEKQISRFANCELPLIDEDLF